MIAKKPVAKKNKQFVKDVKKIVEVLITFAVILVVVLLVGKNFEMIAKKSQLESKILNLTSEIQKLEEQKASLQLQYNETQEDIFVEEQAREKLNLQKEGEQVVVIDGLEYESVDDSENQEQSVFDKIKSLFE